MIRDRYYRFGLPADSTRTAAGSAHARRHIHYTYATYYPARALFWFLTWRCIFASYAVLRFLH